MYLPSDTPLLTAERRHAALCGALSDQRIAETRRMIAQGRIDLFNTVLDPNTAMEVLGLPVAVDVQKLQNQSLDSRGAILSSVGGPITTNLPGQTGGNPGSLGNPSVSDIISNAPEVVSLNAQADQVGCSNVRFSQRPLPADPHPGMPQRGPDIVPSNVGPMYYRGAGPTYPGYPESFDVAHRPVGLTMRYGPIGDQSENPGLTGYAPAWSDAWVTRQNADGSPDVGVMGWIRSNPWLSLAIAGAAVLGLNEASKRRGR